MRSDIAESRPERQLLISEFSPPGQFFQCEWRAEAAIFKLRRTASEYYVVRKTRALTALPVPGITPAESATIPVPACTGKTA